MIERTWAEMFAREWIANWNAHNLEGVLAHYSDDFEMTSPLIVERMSLPAADSRAKKRSDRIGRKVWPRRQT
jgi:hypothetical protein